LVTQPTSTLVIPPQILTAIRDRRAIVFLGAGSSKECKASNGERPPNADQLGQLLAQKFLGTPMPGTDAMTIAEMAISSGVGAPLVFDEIRRIFSAFPTSMAHELLSKFSWRMMATTNYDTYVEQAYEKNKGRHQTLLPFVKNDEPIDDRAHRSTNPLVYLKLHGSLDFPHDAKFPLILSKESYEYHREDRDRLFDRLRDHAYEATIVFIGYRLDDPHIRQLIYKIDQKSRPRWFLVNPDTNQASTDYWNTKNVGVINTTFLEFMTALDAQMPPEARLLHEVFDLSEFPIARFFRGTELSEDLKFALKHDLTHVHNGMATTPIAPKRFYEGYDDGWSGIFQRFDVRRKLIDKILADQVIEHEVTDNVTLVAILGAAGAGKTIALKRTALEASNLGVIALWAEESGALRPETIAELYELSGKTIFLFVDQLSMHVDELYTVLKHARSNKIPLVVIGGEREADWSTYCSKLEEEFNPLHYEVRNLSEDEVEQLVDLLAKHDCLGELKSLPRSAQIAAFVDAEKADRQLLVALHELTQGRPFEDILLDEYSKIKPDKAKQIYLDIATMHQFATKVRAGTISRVSGVDFADFQRDFLLPLANIIKIKTDVRNDDYLYATRHAKIAAIVFTQVCSSDDLKGLQFSRIIEGLDVGYSSDMHAFEEITKGRALATNFLRPDEARRIYDAATSRNPNAAFLWQQYAIFELNHPLGDLELAQRYAADARELDPHNRTIKHTQAEIERNLALRATTTYLKESYRTRARRFLSEMPALDRFAVASRCKLAVDEVVDFSATSDDGSSRSDLILFSDKVKDAEAILTRSQQNFPDEPELFQIEARLRSHLNEDQLALGSLEKAWTIGTKGPMTALKIAEIYEFQGRQDDALTIIKKALAKFSDDKTVHNALAMHYLRNGGESKLIETHLRRSFAAGDNNFEARFNLAQFYFGEGKSDAAMELFDEINSRAPDTFRARVPSTDTLFSERLPTYMGTVRAKDNSYLFVKTPSYKNDIFGHMSRIGLRNFESLDVNDRVAFRVNFFRRGPQIVSLAKID